MRRITSPALSLFTLASALALGGCGADGPAAQAMSAVSSTLTDPSTGADCAGKDLKVTRDNVRLVLHGECGVVTITASHGALNLDKAGTIRVEGSDFIVLNKQVQQVSVTGNDNTLNLTNVGSVEIHGNQNMVLGRDVQRVRFIGNQNTVNQNGKPALDDRGTGNKLL